MPKHKSEEISLIKKGAEREESYWLLVYETIVCVVPWYLRRSTEYSLP